jgi:hypothetical protein
MTNGRDGRQNRNRGRCRISDLRECRTDVADLAGEEVVFVANLRAADWIDVTEFVQHRPLLGEDQQQGKNQCKAKIGSFHGLATNYPRDYHNTQRAIFKICAPLCYPFNRTAVAIATGTSR